jgi:hypothetical protein
MGHVTCGARRADGLLGGSHAFLVLCFRSDPFARALGDGRETPAPLQD